MQISAKGLQVLRYFLDSNEEHSGAELSKALAIGSGTLYPLLLRLEKNGWMESRWEDLDPSEAGRPRRRYYRLTAMGEREATLEFNRLLGSIGWSDGRPVWARRVA
jgi:DNA-binding PadR family transcriptional regulator